MAHTYTHLLYHVIFSTKHRQKLLRADVRPRLFEYMAGIARNEFGHALRIGGVEDHIHALLKIRADVAVSHAMQVWKSSSSKWLNETEQLADQFAWQIGYGAFTVSKSNGPDVTRYIDGQEEHHRREKFESEYIRLLNLHEVEYDERFVFD